jgi:hypothetical protein
MLDIKIEVGKIYHLIDHDKTEYLFLVHAIDSTDRAEVIPLAGKINLKWNTFNITKTRNNNAVIKEVFRGDLPLYVGWTHVSSKLVELISNIIEVSHG